MTTQDVMLVTGIFVSLVSIYVRIVRIERWIRKVEEAAERANPSIEKVIADFETAPDPFAIKESRRG